MTKPHLVATSAQTLITELFDIVDGSRWDELHYLFAPDCLCQPVGSKPLIGLGAIDQYYRNERAIASGHHEIQQIVSDLGAAACWGTFSGQTRAGEHIIASFADTFLVRDQKIVWRATYIQPGNADT